MLGAWPLTAGLPRFGERRLISDTPVVPSDELATSPGRQIRWAEPAAARVPNGASTG